MIHLLFDSLFYLNVKIQEAIIENDKEKVFYYLGQMGINITLYGIEIGEYRDAK